MSNVELICGDCIDKMSEMADKSVDAVICDPPYGTTACKWDSVIPFEPMWGQLERIIKPRGAILLFGAEPFSSALRMSNIKRYKYDWVWKKNRPVGFTNAKNKPLNDHELVSVFSLGTCANRSPKRMDFYPQGLLPFNKVVKGEKRDAKDIGAHRFSRPGHKKSYIQKFTNYPRQVLFYDCPPKPVHPTQKPVALLEYLIKTYTLPGETVLDFTMGSGSTGVAAVNTGRNFVGIELNEGYFKTAQERIAAAQKAKETEQLAIEGV